MAKLYLNKINKGEMILEEVPFEWREEVRLLLQEQSSEPTNEI